MTIWGIFVKQGIVSLLSDSQYYILEGSLIALLSGRFFLRKRYKKIIMKYEDESRIQRKVGAWMLTLYIILTYVVFFVEALYRQGKI